MRPRWRRRAAALMVVATVLVVAVVVGLAHSRAQRGLLHPDGVDAAGSRALTTLLTQRGTTVVPVRTIADALAAARPSDTVLVTVPDLLADEQVDALVDTGARLVLVAPDAGVADFVPTVSAVAVRPQLADPSCALPAARQAGSARAGGLGFRAAPEPTVWTPCYPVDSVPTLVETVNVAGSATVLLGSPDPLTNEFLDTDGNAALALNLLSTDRLVWYRPVPEAGTGDASLTDQLPDWFWAVVTQLAVAAALAALWRGRRLGPIVVEPLPVVVRASETTEGRARLYRRGRDRAHAAQVLRDAAANRLARAGRPTAPVAGLAAAPPDDTALVQFADELDRIEKEAYSP